MWLRDLSRRFGLQLFSVFSVLSVVRKTLRVAGYDGARHFGQKIIIIYIHSKNHHFPKSLPSFQNQICNTMGKKTLTSLAALFALFMISCFPFAATGAKPQPQSFVNYLIPKTEGWYYTGDNASGDSYVFENASLTTAIHIKKEPTLCENSQEFNKVILTYIQSLAKNQEFAEQRKTAAPYPFMGQKFGHMVIVKSRTTNQRRFVLNHLVGTNMYHIEVTANGNAMTPPDDAMAFIAQITAGSGQGMPPSPEAIPQKATAAATQGQSGTTTRTAAATTRESVSNVAGRSQTQTAASNARQSTDTPQGYRAGTTDAANRERAAAASQESAAATNKAQGTAENTQPQSSTAPGQAQGATGTAVPAPQASSGQSVKAPADVPFTPGQIAKGDIPMVKFSATDPCAQAGNDKAMPWNQSGNAKIDLPKGVTAIVPPVVPNLQHLSEFSFNSAVSAAFEAMRLVYGPMPDDEARKFEAAWAPLFDFPTQEIIDYLNKLNPLVSQFLACRESYIRVLNDLHMVMFDASIAIEDDSQVAWEAAMAEAALYTSTLTPLEATMKKIASQIEGLGNPPDPNQAKCEARQRYNRFFSGEYPFEGEWAGDNGEEFLLKVGHTYPDGKVLVYWFPISWLNEMEAKGYDITTMGMQNTEDGGLGIIPGLFDLLKVMEEIEPGFWVSYHWAFDRTMFVYRPDNDVMQVVKYHPPSNWSSQRTLEKYTARKTREPREPIPLVRSSDGTINNWQDLVKLLPADNWGGNKLRGYNQIKSENFLTDIEFALFDKQDKNEEFNRKKQEIENDKDLTQAQKQQMISELEDEYSDIIVRSASGKTAATAPAPAAEATPKEGIPSAAEAEKVARQEAIAFHSEMVDVIKHNMERDIAERNEVRQQLASAKTPEEAKRIADRLKEFDLRIIHHQSNMQAEQDLVDSHKTGELVHTRTVFDDYAHNQFIDNIRENAARMDATRRIAERINRQIDLLPEEMRAEARDRAYKMLDGETVGSGDIEKARKVAMAITNQVQGYAGYDNAMAKEAEIDSEVNEFYAQMAIVAVGAVFVGVGSSALAEAYGAQSAAAIYGTKALGAIYGGTTGAIAGGPKEGVTSAVSYWSPYGYAATQFVDGFQRAGLIPDADVRTKMWQGAKQAGTAWAMGKAFELGAGVVAKGSQKVFGSDNRLFKPVVKTPSQRSKEILDGLRTQGKHLNAADEVATFSKLESQLAILKRDPVANGARIAQMEKELNQLAAGLNMNYYTKWNLKYKADALTRSKYDRRVQQNYSEMTPGMKNRLDQQGYNMEGIEFVQFRNANSGGTSSMDLDLVPVRAGTRNEPAFTVNGQKMVMKKDGTMVTLEQFTDDAQKAMNAEYRRITGLDAHASEMNLVTSVHKEAFSTTKLLDKDVDFSTLSPDEIASIGKVLEVKMDGINKNIMLTNTTKMQAKCRESSKEIENMLLRKLRSDLQQAPAGSPQQKQAAADIKYWEDMLQRFKTIGTDETNPAKIMELNREIMRETGGRDVNGVINDLITRFK